MSILRDVTIKAKRYLDNPEVLLFIGSRQVGKTTVLKQLRQILETQKIQTFFINLEDPDYLDLLNRSPKNLFSILPISLAIKTVVFIDEIQYLKNPSNFLKFFYDEYAPQIKLIVSGSSAFYLDQKFKDSLTGRKKIFYVNTLSFKEFLRFKGEEKLSRRNFLELTLTEQQTIRFHFQEYILYGGYPRVVLAPLEEKKEVLQEIAYSYVKNDIYEAHVKDSEAFYKLFKLLASGVGRLVNQMELASTLGVSHVAIAHYLTLMRKSFHVTMVRPFYKNLRKELTKMPKVFFRDLGLRNFFSGQFDPYETRMDKGALLENIAFRQLLECYPEEDIKFWRTLSQHEVDFVIGQEAFEVKASPAQFKPSKYKVFQEHYSDIHLTIITLEPFKSKKRPYGGLVPVIEAWQLG